MGGKAGQGSVSELVSAEAPHPSRASHPSRTPGGRQVPPDPAVSRLTKHPRQLGLCSQTCTRMFIAPLGTQSGNGRSVSSGEGSDIFIYMHYINLKEVSSQTRSEVQSSAVFALRRQQTADLAAVP